jgi:hypothetical protein
MSLARTVVVFVFLAGVGIALAAWGPVADRGYAGASVGLLGGTMVGAALAFIVSSWVAVAGLALARGPDARATSPGAAVQRAGSTGWRSTVRILSGLVRLGSLR